jgi:hypothetical protein
MKCVSAILNVKIVHWEAAVIPQTSLIRLVLQTLGTLLCI